MAEQALAFAWAIHLEFPAAEQLLEEWATQKLFKPGAPLVDLSEILSGFPKERQQALMRLAREAEADDAVRCQLVCFNNGLEIDSHFRCEDVFYSLLHFIRAADKAGPLPLLPLSEERTEAIFKYYGFGRDDWDTELIYGSEACGAIVELLQALKLEGTAETGQGAPQ